MRVGKKGVNALEMVFAMFILIVVTLVIIRLFSAQVSGGALPKIDDFRQAYDYDKQVTSCKSLCSLYTNTCEDLSAAVDFCRKKVSIDIDGNFKSGEKGHFGVVKGQPYCEDGLYCFHVVEDCSCGNYVLNAKTCLQIMKDYYTETIGYDVNTANTAIFNAIQPGTCLKDPRDWKVKLPGYTPTPALGSDAKFGTGNECNLNSTTPVDCIIGADYWWRQASYNTLVPPS